MNEEEYKRIVKNIEKEKDYRVVEGILYRIEGNKELRIIRRFEYEGLMHMMHDHELSGHFGIDATYRKIKEKYYWKGMFKDIEVYVKSCDRCQRRGKPQGKHELHSIKAEEPFSQIGIDVVGPLPITEKGNKYIVVAMDYFTKWPEAKAIKRANAAEISKFIYEEIICRHGCPRKILTDNGTEFNNQLIKDLTGKLGTQHKFSTPYHPKTNGLVERFNRTLCESLAKLGGKDWDDKIAPVLFAYRTKIQKSTKMKPFYLLYGREAKLPVDKDINRITLGERVKELMHDLTESWNRAKENIKGSQEKQKEYYDKHGKRKQEFNVGDKVLLYDAAKEKQWSGKLNDKWKGPYYIYRKIIYGSYQIKEIDGRVLKTPVNGELLKLYFDREKFEPMIYID